MCCRGATRLIVHLGKSGIRSVVEVGSQEQHNLALSYLVISKKVKWDVCIPQLRSVLIYKELGEQYCSPNSLYIKTDRNWGIHTSHFTFLEITR